MIVEANFDGVHAPARFAESRRRYRIAPFEIHCTASEKVLRDRYTARAGLRHPGHADAERLAERASFLSDKAYPALGLGGPIVVFDTTDLTTLDLGSLVPACAAHLRPVEDGG